MERHMTTQTSPLPTGVLPYESGADAQSVFDAPVLGVLSELPGVVAITITDRPSGTLVYVGLEDMAVEDAVYERLAAAQADYGSVPLKLVVVPLSDWARLEFSPSARRYTRKS
jgi:hypothetical protein